MTAVLQTQLVAAYSNKLVAMMPVSGRSPEAQAASATANLAQATKKAEASVQLKALLGTHQQYANARPPHTRWPWPSAPFLLLALRHECSPCSTLPSS